MAKAVPEGYHTLTAQLALDGAAEAIELYKRAFGAEEIDRAPDPTGKKVWHAALRIGNSMLFVNDVFPDMGGSASNSAMWLYVDNCDASVKRALDAGCKATMPVMDMFWGDRMGQVVDRWGIKWTIATHVKDMTKAEMDKAMQEFLKQQKK